MNFRRELSTICRRCEIWLVESEADPCAVLLWGEDQPIRQAIMQLEALDYKIQPQKWAKSHAYDGRKESRKDLMAIEEEQAARLEALAEGQVFPYEVSSWFLMFMIIAETCSMSSSGQTGISIFSS